MEIEDKHPHEGFMSYRLIISSKNKNRSTHLVLRLFAIDAMVTSQIHFTVVLCLILEYNFLFLSDFILSF